MVSKIVLNNRVIPIYKYDEYFNEGRRNIVVDFNVTSEDYHDIATLLYEGTFNVQVPEKNLEFKGSIQNYYTSITNLYKEGEVADYHLRLQEVQEKSEFDEN